MSDDLCHPVRHIAAKDITDASRDGFIVLITVFLVAAAMASLVTGAIALATDAATYSAARATLLALGKSVDVIAAPELYPLKLLRGTIEQTEIIGAAIAILIGYRAAVTERGRQTLALIMTRPVRRWQFLAGKAVAGLASIGAGLGSVLILAAVTLHWISGVGLTLGDLGRILIVWAVAVAYAACFLFLSFIMTLSLRRPPHALLLSFSVWLLLVLIAPQIGDTLDPDNQVAGGVFAQLHIAKPEQQEIMKGFATYETIRNGIEVASITKHFERFSFAVLGIKDSYTGKPLRPILIEKWGDALWIFLTTLGLGALLLALPIRPNRLTED
jgi:ABC-2 type transport system permease protein